MTQITYEEWLDSYKPTQNHLIKDASYEGMLFETYGEELAYVHAKKDQWLVWTLVEDDDGNNAIVSGYHYVNQLGYFVCENPVNPKNFIEVREED